MKKYFALLIGLLFMSCSDIEYKKPEVIITKKIIERGRICGMRHDVMIYLLNDGSTKEFGANRTEFMLNPGDTLIYHNGKYHSYRFKK